MTVSAAQDNALRRIYLVLSPRSLPYARIGMQTLLLHSLEPLEIVFLTDSPADRHLLQEAITALDNPRLHSLRVVEESELEDLEAAMFAAKPNLRNFRRGHPCWRKITDPLLLSKASEEMVILDPDLFFPNRFRFEATPASGVLLMWQKPNCLLPPKVVKAAIESRIPLARHVDIGVAHWRASAADLDWLEWLLGKLGGVNLPRAMHVEAIVWAAIAMREGGGYLDPAHWRCWQRTAAKRLMRKLGASGERLLSSEPWDGLKCFHAGGEAKWWLAALEQGRSTSGVAEHGEAGVVQPFVELTPARYTREEALKRCSRGLDYFEIFR